MVQDVIRLSLITKAQVRFRFSLCGICGERSGIGTDFASSTSVVHFHFYSAMSYIHTGMRCITAFRSTADRIYDGGLIRLYYNVTYI
jgi:hypothetical protein